MKNTILNLSLLVAFSVNINASQHVLPVPSAPALPQYEPYEPAAPLPQAPGGPGAPALPIAIATPIKTTRTPDKGKTTEDFFSKGFASISQGIKNNPKISISLGILATASLYAYRNSPSFKKDVDEKIAKAKHYFKNDLTVNKVAGGLAVSALLYMVGYIIYQDIKKADSKKSH